MRFFELLILIEIFQNFPVGQPGEAKTMRALHFDQEGLITTITSPRQETRR